MVSSSNPDELELSTQALSCLIEPFVKDLTIITYYDKITIGSQKGRYVYIMIYNFGNNLVCHSLIPTLNVETFDLYDPNSINRLVEHIKYIINSHVELAARDARK